MVQTSFSDANVLKIFSGGSLHPGHTVMYIMTKAKTKEKSPYGASLLKRNALNEILYYLKHWKMSSC